MDNYDNLQNSLEHYRDTCRPYDQATGAIDVLQGVIGEKQELLKAAIVDLAEGSDCKYCTNIDQCSSHQIERNCSYRGCARWQWRGVMSADKSAEAPLRKQ